MACATENDFIVETPPASGIEWTEDMRTGSVGSTPVERALYPAIEKRQGRIIKLESACQLAGDWRWLARSLGPINPPGDAIPRRPRIAVPAPAWGGSDSGRSPCARPVGVAAQDAVAGFRPVKVLGPDLYARVEQADELARDGIEGRDPTTLGVVAQRAGEPEISFHSLATEGFRNEVIEFHGRADHGLLAQAITAAIACLSTDLDTQGLRDVRAAHPAPISFETSWPRCFNKTAAWTRISTARSYCRTRSARVRTSISVSPSRCRL